MEVLRYALKNLSMLFNYIYQKGQYQKVLEYNHLHCVLLPAELCQWMWKSVLPAILQFQERILIP